MRVRPTSGSREVERRRSQKNCDCTLTVGSDLLKRLEERRPLEVLQSLCENETEELLGGRVGPNYFIALNDCGDADS
jgi:hypothetical protein